MASTQKKRLIQKALKRFLGIYAVLVLITLVFGIPVFETLEKERREALASSESGLLDVAEQLFESALHESRADIDLLAHLPLLGSYLNRPDEALRRQIEAYFVTFLQAYKHYDQVRYIDQNGLEIIRANDHAGKPDIVAREALQHKGARYYFQQSIRLPRGDIYVSPMDLNRERGEIEQPHKPVIRFGVPVYDAAGELRGVIVINRKGGDLLQAYRQLMKRSDKGHGVLLNADGYWLVGPKQEDEWGFALDRPEVSFARRLPQVWSALKGQPQGRVDTPQGLFLFKAFTPNWHRPVFSHTREASPVTLASDRLRWFFLRHIPLSELAETEFFNRSLIGLGYLLLALLTWQFAYYSVLRQEAQRRLARSVRQMETSQRIARLGSWQLDEDLQALFGSDQFKQLLPSFDGGFDGFIDQVHANDQLRVRRTFEQAMNRRESFALEFRLQEADAEEIRHVRAEGAVINDPTQGRPHLEGTLQDISERWRAKEHVQRLIGIIDRSPDFVGIADTQGRLSFHNRAALRLVGLAEDADLSCLKIGDMHPPQAARRVLTEAIPEAIKQGSYTFDNLLLRRDGREIPVSQTVMAHLDEDGSPAYFSTIMRDITEVQRTVRLQEQARVDAEAANQAKSEFLANMSHEIRTPLNGITGMARMLREEAIDATQRERCEIMERSAEALMSLINSVLDLSRIEAGSLTLESVDLDLPRLIDDVWQAQRVVAEQKGLSLLRRSTGELPRWCRGDPGRLRQVLNNLVGNAIKFTPKGRVLIHCGGERGREGCFTLRIAVEDQGIGMSPDQQERLFERFSQADSSISRKYGGSGLGLTICKQLVERMGGQIGLDSVLGAGSTFWFTLPLELAAEQDQTAAPERLQRRRFDARALVVDDVLTNQRVAQAMLNKLGLEVVLADGGAQALEQLATESFDLVFMDIQMPEMDGVEVVRRIRAPDSPVRDRQLPIVAMTAHASAQDAAAYLQAGMQAHLAKPVDFDQLQRLLQQMLPLARQAEVAAQGSSPADTGSGTSRETSATVNPDQPQEAPLWLGRDAVLEQLMLGQPEIMAEVIETFRQEMPRLMARLQQAMADADAAVATTLAHNIKGAASNVGALRLSVGAKHLEALLKQGQWPAGHDLYQQLQQDLSLLLDEIDEAMKRNP